MTRRLGLRTRLTLLVTVVFATAIVLTSVVVVSMVEDDLVADTKATAESVLASYLDSVYGGTATVGVLNAADSTRFFYLDEDGVELSEQEYFQTIAAGFDAAFALPPDFTAVPSGAGIVSSGVIVDSADGLSPFAIEVDPVTGDLLDRDGAVITLVAGPEPIGEPRSVDIGDGAVGVAQTLSFSDGTTLAVGVSSPLQPVTDSLDTIRRLLWAGVPTLILVVAAITWLATSRALAPVHAITSRAREISAASIDDRLPVGDANDEIQELAHTMNEMLTRLELSQHRQQRLVADASHELRSPVAASRVQLEVAQANPATTDWEATAATVLAEQEHLSRLIDDLLALSRIDEAAPLVSGDVDLDDLIETEAHRPHPVAVATAIAEPVRVSGDRSMLARALRNLVDNAARHATSQVWITLRRDGKTAVIDVDDDGSGIAVQARNRVFERFSRLDEARDRGAGGTGLGLAIVREVALAHHGSVSVSESPAGGARLSLVLPLPDC